MSESLSIVLLLHNNFGTNMYLPAWRRALLYFTKFKKYVHIWRLVDIWFFLAPTYSKTTYAQVVEIV